MSAAEGASEQSGASERVSDASERVSGGSERANGRASHPVLQSGFLIILDHSNTEESTEIKKNLGKRKDGIRGRPSAESLERAGKVVPRRLERLSDSPCT